MCVCARRARCGFSRFDQIDSVCAEQKHIYFVFWICCENISCKKKEFTIFITLMWSFGFPALVGADCVRICCYGQLRCARRSFYKDTIVLDVNVWWT